MNTEQAGAAKIQEDTDSLKVEFDKLIADLQDVRNKLTSRAAQFDDISKVNNCLKLIQIQSVDCFEKKYVITNLVRSTKRI